MSNQQATTVVQPLAGQGLATRQGDLLLLCADTGTGIDDLLALLDDVAAAGGDGSVLVRRVAALLANDFESRVNACAVSGPTADGRLAVLVYGSATAHIVSRDGELSLSGADAITSVDRLVAGPIAQVRLELPGAGTANPRSRLDSGVVEAAGILAVTAVSASFAPPVGDVPLREAPVPAQAPPVRTEEASAWPVSDEPPGLVQAPQEPAEQPAWGVTEPPAPVDGPQQDAESPAWPVIEEPPAPVAPPVYVDPPVPPAYVDPPAPSAYGDPPTPPPYEGYPPADAEPALPTREPGAAVDMFGGPAAARAVEAGVESEAVDSRPLVLGVSCSAGHFNDPSLSYCVVCGVAMADTVATHEAPRPAVGTLLLDDGTAYPLDLDYLLGREPEPDPDVVAGRVRPLRIIDPEGLVSRRHVRIMLSGWQAQVLDLGSANGTTVQRAGEAADALPPHLPVMLTPGTVVTLGRRWFRFEAVRPTT